VTSVFLSCPTVNPRFSECFTYRDGDADLSVLEGKTIAVIEEDLSEIVRENQGVFAKEWQLGHLLVYPVFNKLLKRAFENPINEAERRLREREKIDLP